MTKELKNKTEYVAGAISIIAFIIVSILMFHYMLRYDREMKDVPLEGTGQENDPYIISTLEDYLFFARELSDYGSKYADSFVALESDIDLGEEDGYIGNDSKGIFFAGVFDGRGHAVRGISCEGKYPAMFPRLMGTVRNLRVEDAHVKGKYAAGIAGVLLAGGNIVNCYAEGDFIGDDAAGICGYCMGRVENCYSPSAQDAVRVVGEGGAVSGNYGAKDDEKEALNALNANIENLMPECAYHVWESGGDGLAMGPDVAITPVMIAVRTTLGGKDFDLQACFSRPERKWLMVLPRCCRQDEFSLRISLSDGTEIQRLVRLDSPEFELGSRSCRLEFVFYDDVPTVLMSFYDKKELSYLYPSKELYETGELFVADETGNRDMRSSQVIFNGRGNDSYKAEKKGYSIELPAQFSIAGMEKTYDYNLLPGYRDNCLLNYMFTRDLYRDMGLEYAHEYRMVNLFVNGRFQGLYFLTEKVKISESAFDLENLPEKSRRLNGSRLYNYPMATEQSDSGTPVYYYDLPHAGNDVTGGYIMEVTMTDYTDMDSRFTTDRGVIFTSKADRYLGKKEIDYIRARIQDYEDAVASPDGYNEKGIYYADYIDMRSFADQWILFELAADISDENSVYYFKDSDSRGDGKFHAVWYWDAEHMLVEERLFRQHMLMRRAEKGVDTSRMKPGGVNFWTWPYQHEDFRQMLATEWKERFVPALRHTLEGSADEKGTFEWYRNNYTASFNINDRCWYNTDFLGKCDELSGRLADRIDFLNDYFK